MTDRPAGGIPGNGRPDDPVAGRVAGPGPIPGVEPRTDLPIGVHPGERAPAVRAVDRHGRSHDSAEWLGLVSVLDFWATWCRPCRKIMPILQSIHERYAAHPVRVFGVHGLDPADPGPVFEDLGCSYELLVGADEVFGSFGSTSIPMVIVIAPDGRIALRRVGHDPDLGDRLEEVIDAELSAFGVEPPPRPDPPRP